MKASDYGGKVANSVGEWCYSVDEELFHGSFPEREDAVGEAMEYHPDETVYVGRASEVEIHGPDASRVVELLSESAYDAVGELAEDYLAHVPPDALRELGAGIERVIGLWLTKYDLWPTFFAVEGVEKVVAADRA